MTAAPQFFLFLKFSGKALAKNISCSIWGRIFIFTNLTGLQNLLLFLHW
jgi:hypothetical protein